jgi:predicted porin
MRKILLGSLLAVGTVSAFAQSTVTVYGVADAFAAIAKGSSSDKRMTDGGNIASQLGFRGTEDLGGGLIAQFRFEGGLNLDTGIGTIPGPGYAFTRQSFVGLESKNWGKVNMGRQYTPLFGTTYTADPLGNNAIFSPVLLWAQTDAQPGLSAWAARTDNAVAYSSPSSLPVVGTLMYGPGESTNNTSSGNYLGASLAYRSGDLWLGWGYQNKKSGSAAAPAAAPTESIAQVLAGKYTVGPFVIGASWGHQGSNTVGSPKANLLNLNSQYVLGASSFYLSYGSRDVSGSARDQTAVTLGYDYNLSKSTAIYARYLSLSNKGNSNVSLGGVAVSPNSGASVQLTGIGVTQKF